MDPNVVAADVRPKNREVFARQWLRFGAVGDGRDGSGSDEIYDALLSDQTRSDTCASKSSHLVVVWDGWVADLQIACSAGELVHYELGDFLGFLSEVLGDHGRPTEALVSLCGRMKFERIALATLLDNATESRVLWGKRYPERRLRARTSAQPQPKRP